MTRPKTATAEKTKTPAAPQPIRAELVPKDAPAAQPAVEPDMFDPHKAVAIAVRRGDDAVTIERLIQFARNADALAEERRARAAKLAWIRAVTAFKANPPQIKKKSTVDYTPSGKPRVFYRYANLDDVVSNVIPALAEHSLSHRWEMKQESQQQTSGPARALITVTCFLQHADGHHEVSELFAYPDESGGKNPIQAVQSTVSYLQRYTLLGILGLSTGDDDDAGGPGEPQMSDEDARKLDGFMSKLDEATFLDQLRDVRKEAIQAYGSSAKLPPAFASKYEGLRTEFERKQREGAT